MTKYTEAMDAEDYRAAAEILQHTIETRPADIGADVRRILMDVRLFDTEHARQTYHNLRTKVMAAYDKGILVENDLEFLLVQQVGACVQDGLSRIVNRDRDANGGELPATPSAEFLAVVELQEEIIADAVIPATKAGSSTAVAVADGGGGVSSWSQRIQGGVEQLLGPNCYDDMSFVVTITNANCSLYRRRPSLCNQPAQCHSNDGRSPLAVRHCDTLQMLKHTDACCACGGGRNFGSTASGNKRGDTHRKQAMALGGGDESQVYMQLKHRPTRRRRRRRRG